ncbi:NAD-dependent epimerase/dehydratase family protein [Chloroflexota bacterium]
MTYLITGGTGLIGTHVIQLLVQDGARVVIYDINPARNRMIDSLLERQGGNNIEIIRGDILDLAYLIHIVQEYKVNRIIHLAALQEVYAGNPLIAITQINCIGTINILETARILGMEKVVWMSSQTVFSQGQKNITDDTLHDPRSIYAATKSFSEQVAKYYFSEYGVDNIGIRPGTVYGAELSTLARGGSWSMTKELMVNPALGKPGEITSGRSVDWMYVEDVARAIVMASKAKTTKSRIFNVTGDFRTMDEAINHVKKLIPDAELTVTPRPNIPSEKRDSSGAKREIGFEFQWTMEQGIEKTIKDVRNGIVKPTAV